MPVSEVKHLFTLKRLPNNDFNLIHILLYLPIGLILVLLRTLLVIIVFIIGCISDTTAVQKLINKIACMSLGISVTVENPTEKENVEVFISNNLSVFDHLAVNIVTGALSPETKIYPIVYRGFGYHHFNNQSNNMESFKKSVLQLINEHRIPVHFSPEGKITNGKALLKFKTYPFSFSNKIQPICISIERPYLQIALNTLGSNYWFDVLCYMFSPSTNYKLKFLPSLDKNLVTDVEFSDICRHNLANALKIELSDFTANDLNEYEKRKLSEMNRQTHQIRMTVAPDNEYRRMAMQVKDVLPHVPFNAIFSDLKRTRSVDNTITNILEGRLTFIPEPIPSSSNNSMSTILLTNRNDNNTNLSMIMEKNLFNTAATTFARSAIERNKSFKERKEQLIANARQRYIEKHNLKI